jgi:hypothetical protein
MKTIHPLTRMKETPGVEPTFELFSNNKHSSNRLANSKNSKKLSGTHSS